METIRVAVVDDDALVRTALTQFIETDPRLYVAYSCENGQDLLTRLAGDPVDVVLMDVFMPVMDGVTAVRQMQLRHPEVKVLLLTSLLDDDTIEQGFAAGATGYLLKTEEPEAISEGIRAAFHGNLVVANAAFQRLFATRREEVISDICGQPEFNQREKEVLTLMCNGRTNVQIAKELALSLASIKLVVTQILQRIGVTTRVQAVALACQNKWVDLGR